MIPSSFYRPSLSTPKSVGYRISADAQVASIISVPCFSAVQERIVLAVILIDRINDLLDFSHVDPFAKLHHQRGRERLPRAKFRVPDKVPHVVVLAEV